MDDEVNCSLVYYGVKTDENIYSQISTFLIARIPYENIVETDVDGDQYYPQPHIYCRFAHGGEPYEGFRRVLIGADYPWPLAPTKAQLEQLNPDSGGVATASH